jgi:hypothetical protein
MNIKKARVVAQVLGNRVAADRACHVGVSKKGGANEMQPLERSG